MDGLQLINQLNDLQKDLTNTITDMEKRGVEYSVADAKYRVAVRKTMLRLRDEGIPVTIIRDLVLGEVAHERNNMNIAEAYYKTAQEKIQAIKLQMRLIDNQIQREYGQQ